MSGPGRTKIIFYGGKFYVIMVYLKKKKKKVGLFFEEDFKMYLSQIDFIDHNLKICLL